MTLDEAFCILHSLPDDWKTSEADVQQVEDQLGVRLPPPLRELMLCTGRRMHWLFPDNEIPTLLELPELREAALEIVASDVPSLHPVFPYVTLSQHAGYAFTFVRAEVTDGDPAVLQYYEGRGVQKAPCGLSIRQFIGAAVQKTLSDA